MATISSPPLKHIPAWKRLGLKLKNGKEERQEALPLTNGTLHEHRNSHKRKGFTESETLVTAPVTEEPLKKKKKAKSILVDIDSATSVTLSANSTDPTSQLLNTPTLQKRKSVTFAPEAKAEDGDSVKQLYKNWLTSQQASDPDLDVNKLNPALKSVTPASTKTTPEQPATALTDNSLSTDSKPNVPKKKKQKKFKSTPQPPRSPLRSSSANNNESLEYIHPALTYLTIHHTTPNLWKFNKAHQNYLLKHLFRLTHVPSHYDPALAPYLKGLASENTRARIRREALDIRTDDEKWLASPSANPNSKDKQQEENDADNTEDADPAMGIERETPTQSLARRLRDYNSAVEKMRQILKAKEDAHEAAQWEAGSGRRGWEARLMKRRRAEVVLWGVGEVGEQVVTALKTAAGEGRGAESTSTARKVDEQPAFRREMGPKRIRFEDDEEAKPTATNDNNVSADATKAAVALTDGKKKRKRKRATKDRRGAIPDDFSSSSSGSSDVDIEMSEDEETKRVMQRKQELQERLAAQKRELERARREVKEELSDESSDEDDAGPDSEERARVGGSESEDGEGKSSSGSNDDGEDSD